MNTLNAKQSKVVKLFAIAAISSFLLVNCASTPKSPPGADDVRAKLTQLKSDPNLGSRAPIEIKEAEAAVRLAEIPVPKDKALGLHRVQMADYTVELAVAKASTRFAEDQRVQLSEQRENARLLARTREADMARRQADMARLDASHARDDANAARASEANAASNAARQAENARYDANLARDAAKAEAAHQAELTRTAAENARALAAADAANAARQVESAQGQANTARKEADAAKALAATDSANAARQVESAQDETNRARKEADAARALAEANAADSADAAKQKEELQRQIALLEAKTTDRGLVLTLGNVLFATGKAELKSGATNALDKLVSFLNQYPDRNAIIEGHTDNVGTSLSNQALSQRRAESVQSYLLQHGIGSQRLAASGMGEDEPIAENESETGRQQNRRVEIIIDNPPLVAAAMSENQ